MLKEFFKNISIYGILPVVGKFMGFLLVPLYAKMFSVEEFGMIDVIDVLVFFLLLLTSFEIPTALGRYFYDSKESNYKKTIISTGLYLTLFFTVIFTSIAFMFEKDILIHYIGSAKYKFIFRLALIWLFIATINTYLSFVPRYDNRPKQYVIISIISISTKLLSTVLFVVVFRMGLKGVFWGYICGSGLSSLIFFFMARDLITLKFSKPLAKKMLFYSAPLMFGVLAMGAWSPLSRYLMLSFFPIAFVGYYSFSIRIVSVNSIIHSALGMAWKPMLFENKDHLIQANHIKRISGIVSFFSLSLGVVLTLLAPEITLGVGKSDFLGGVAFIGLLALAGSIKALTELRGFAPYLTNKTYVVSIANISALVACSLMMLLFKDKLGITGIGLVMILYEAINYIIRTLYTYRKYRIPLHNSYEVVLLVFLFVAELTIINIWSLITRLVLLLLLLLYALYVFKLMGGVAELKKLVKQRNRKT